MAAVVGHRQQRGRWHRAGRRAAAVASQTQDPFIVSLALMFDYLPMLIFGVIGGAVADRFDRRRMVIIANIGRAAGAGGARRNHHQRQHQHPRLILASIYVLGTAETFADSASSTLLPNVVRARRPGHRQFPDAGRLHPSSTSSSRRQSGRSLFALGMALPFAANAAAFLLGALLISRLSSQRRRPRTGQDGGGDLRI